MIGFCLVCCTLMIVVAFALAGLRLHRGPTMFDRVLASDTLAICIVALLVLLALYTRSTYAIDVMMLISLLGFVTPTAFVDYLYNQSDEEQD